MRAPPRRNRAQSDQGLVALCRSRGLHGVRRLGDRRLPARAPLRGLGRPAGRRRSTGTRIATAMGMVGAASCLPVRGAGTAFDRREPGRAGRSAASRGSTSCATAIRARSRPAAARTAARPSPSRSGLLGVATPAELEGIVAHELAHLRNRDTIVQTSAVVDRRRDRRVLAARRLVSASDARRAGPARRLVRPHRSLSPKREFEADRFAAELCGSPHGLADALVRLELAAGLVAFQASPATEPLYTTNPFAEEGLARLFITHPPLGERVRRLRALDPEWREKLHAA